ncbi:hypothetical protein [Streptomyces echinatus]|uniref:Uncharacterized protein n=1 Tax=Streptomyces echinatus TaxID=67293 RepID=A0A7W9UV29_9ACTN|nr:hypothetical protein [Streptomyces echinatus]MBB5932177.1 hypothetical protein [Streptomyces echinatus]
MRSSSWGAELLSGLRPLSRVVLSVCLCGLAVPLWFAAQNTYRFVEGHHTKTEGYVHCESGGPCHGAWRLPGGQRGNGEIRGLPFAADEELLTDLPLYAGRDWAVADRSALLASAAWEYAGTGIGAALTLSIAWNRSYSSGSRDDVCRRRRRRGHASTAAAGHEHDRGRT